MTDLARQAPASLADLPLGTGRLSAREAGGAGILLAARSDGLFASVNERRVVLVEEADALPDPQALRELPADAAVVLLAEGSGAADLAKVVRDLGGVVEELRPLREAAAQEWIARRADAVGLPLDAESKLELSTALGGDSERGADLERAERELAKLAAYAGGEKLRAKDVRALVPGAIESQVFDLTRAVVHRDVRSAVEVLERLLDAGEPPQRLLGLLVWQFRVLLVAAAGTTDRDLERSLAQTGLSRNAVLRWRREAARIRPSFIARAYESLYAADMALKGGRVDPRTGLQLLVLDLCVVEGADLRSLAERAP